VDAERLANGTMLVHLSGEGLSAGNTTTKCDLLIVADGASSKVRARLRPDDTLQYVGVRQKGGLAVFPDGIPSLVDKKWGLLLSSGKGVACFLSPCDATSVAWGVSYWSPTVEEPLKIQSMQNAQSGNLYCLIEQQPSIPIGIRSTIGSLSGKRQFMQRRQTV
jgi:2-polyprenyl-6-methoxyphenol hydroxylase-like FAD-dependent oxidoreductase